MREDATRSIYRSKNGENIDIIRIRKTGESCERRIVVGGR